MFVAIIVATYLGRNPSGFRSSGGGIAFVLLAALLLPALMMVFSRNAVNSTGAVAAYVSGFDLNLGFTSSCFLGWFPLSQEQHLFATHQITGCSVYTNCPLCYCAVINFVVAFTVSSMTAPPPKTIQDL